jgi:hypothetical protein
MTSPPDWYFDWVTHHSRLFSLPPEWGDAAEGWWDVFRRLGGSAERLNAATAEVQAGPRLWKVGDHLPAVRAALGLVIDREAAARLRATPSTTAGESCPECGGSGTVLVPWPADVRPDKGGEIRWWYYNHHKNGHPNYRVGVVACFCSAARRPEQMSLGRYEREIFPTWRAAMRRVEEDRAAMQRAVLAARDVSRLPANLAAAMGMPPRCR